MVATKRAQRIHGEEAQRTGIVLGLVAAVGSDVVAFEALLKRQLAEFSYKPSVIRITDLLRRVTVGGKRLPTSPEGKRLSAFMDLGNKMRNQADSGDILALYAAAEIKRLRAENDDSQTAYVIRTLKHPGEVNALRRIYGHGFFLIGLYTDEEARQEYLVQSMDVAKTSFTRTRLR